MKIDTAGNYTLRYTAKDECGNETVVDRTLVVEPPTRTVLYEDGTFIINELGRDRARNESLYGTPIREYNPFDPDSTGNLGKYIFLSTSKVPWRLQLDQITTVLFGETIRPFSLAYWFYNAIHMTNIETQNIDTSIVNDMQYLFTGCNSLRTVDVSNFDTQNVKDMSFMFNSCSSLKELDLSSFDTRQVHDLVGMFQGCTLLEKIYVSNLFTTASVTDGRGTFSDMSSNLIGGSGTVWSSSHTDYTYARIDGGASNPGYFTLKTGA